MVGRSHVLWGVVGGLSFLVLLQAYELISGYRAPITTKAGLAIAVTAVAALLTAVLERRLRGKGSP